MSIVSQLMEARARLVTRPRALPSPAAIAQVVSDLRAALFPDHAGAEDVSPEGIARFAEERLRAAMTTLREQVRRAVCTHVEPCACEARAAGLLRAFEQRLPSVRALLAGDVEAAFDGDPAAKSHDEILLCYPGLEAVMHHRLAHELLLLGVPLVPRMIAARAHDLTAVDIHPGARVGERFFIDHGTGVVVGETAEIGARVRIYQGVTLGAKSFELDAAGNPRKGVPRHPIVEDDVIIYAGATILGRVTIGAGSVIGGNVWLTRGVPRGSRVTQQQPRQEAFDSGAGI